MPNSLSPGSRWVRAGIAAAVLGLLVAMAAAGGSPRLHPLPCGFHALTGLPCALCGGTRAALALMRGDWSAAAYLNPLAFAVVPVAFLLAATFLIEALRGRSLHDWSVPIPRRIVAAALAACLALWLAHITLALKTPKPELVDIRNPIAGKLRSLFESR